MLCTVYCSYVKLYFRIEPVKVEQTVNVPVAPEMPTADFNVSRKVLAQERIYKVLIRDVNNKCKQQF